MAFNPIADALCLLFVDIKPRNAPGHSYFGQHTDNRGKGGKGGKGDWQRAPFIGTCWNCGIAGHRSNDCFKAGGGANKGKGGKSGKGGKGTSIAMTAKDGQQVRGAALSSDE